MAQGTPSQKPVGIDFFRNQEKLYARNAWTVRWIGWVCTWGAATCAGLAGFSEKLFPTSPSVPIWFGCSAVLVTAITQTFKPEMWADAYYRGHLALETVLGDYELNKATEDDISKAWHLAQSGLPSTGARG